jgi:hypothetical protein
MKTRSTFFSILLAATVFVFLTNCSGKKEESAETQEAHDHEHASGSTASEETTAPQFEVDATFQQQLGSVFSSYVTLKDAFVSSDAAKVKAEAANTNQSLSKVDMKLLSGPAHNDWMTYLAPMQSSLKEMEGSSDIEAQRKSFSTLSDNLYKSIKAFGLGGKQAFYEYCPMAFNNEGGYWLSDEDKIRNPYFGDKMLTCGTVKEKLK